MKYIDLRSDTVTKPSPDMLQAMVGAEVGDDVFNDDPTVKKLEAMVAEMLGKEASLYVPSGSMSNQVAIYTASERGDEILCETGSHIINYEVAAPAVISGLLTHPLDGEMGILSAETIKSNIRARNIHCPVTKIVALENTHNRAGGTIYPVEVISDIQLVAEENGLWMHLDGARLWNAHVAAEVALDRYGSFFDSVSVCLSKGLGAPIGSVLAGSKDFIEKARRTRKMFGGGMRQVGILAAAGIYALENNISRLAVDHGNALMLAESLNDIAGLKIDMKTVQTNIVIVEVDPGLISVDRFLDQLKKAGVLCVPFGPTSVRFVTHLDVTEDDCRHAAEAVLKLMDGLVS